MIHRLIVALSLVVLHLAQHQAVPAKEYSADRFDASIAVQEGGSLIVTKTVTFKFVGGPFTYVFRDIPTNGAMNCAPTNLHRVSPRRT